ncbi:MAG TPA: Hsp20/alpha crystallin family protein [Patescibacteria group bacterium]|nr:Hsp20/alpha crystallin family protein [Patescibacteria group bacterium]
MKNSSIFTKKIKELTPNEVEYTEDFFKQAFGENADTTIALEQSAKEGPQDLSHQFTDQDIDENWLNQTETFEGQLAVDVLQTKQDIYIIATVAGLRAHDLDIDMNGDMITIRGVRRHRFLTAVSDEDYFIRECYWGGFSRSIILPVDIQYDGVEATLENGVLTIRLPKSKRSRNAKIEVVDISQD